MTKLLAFLLALSLLAMACGSDSDAPSGAGTDPLVGTVWQLSAATLDGVSLALLDSHPVTLTGDGAAVSGVAACNNYGGSYELVGETITIADMFMTEMACFPDEVNLIETTYLGALARVTTITAEQATLVATGEGVELTFSAQVPPADAPLVGTMWLLESIITGDAVSSTVADSASSLSVAADGSISGSTGCNQFNGQVDIGDSSFGPAGLATTRMACDEALMLQEQQVVTVLSGGPSFVIAGPSLTLTLADGTGLQYRAQN